MEVGLQSHSVVDVLGGLFPLVIVWCGALVCTLVVLVLFSQSRRVPPAGGVAGLGLTCLAAAAFAGWQINGSETAASSAVALSVQTASMSRFLAWGAGTAHAVLLTLGLLALSLRKARFDPRSGAVPAAVVLVAFVLLQVNGWMNTTWVMTGARGLGYLIVGGLMALTWCFRGESEDDNRPELRATAGWVYVLTVILGELGVRGLGQYLAFQTVLGSKVDIQEPLSVELCNIIDKELPWQAAVLLLTVALACWGTVKHMRADGRSAAAGAVGLWLVLVPVGLMLGEVTPELMQLALPSLP